MGHQQVRGGQDEDSVEYRFTIWFVFSFPFAVPLSLELTTLGTRYDVLGTAQGLPALHNFIDSFVSHVYDPGYADFKTVINAGSTDAWGKIVTTLCEPGDGVLCEEWTYPSALA
jgi:hypothetical protein